MSVTKACDRRMDSLTVTKRHWAGSRATADSTHPSPGHPARSIGVQMGFSLGFRAVLAFNLLAPTVDSLAPGSPEIDLFLQEVLLLPARLQLRYRAGFARPFRILGDVDHCLYLVPRVIGSLVSHAVLRLLLGQYLGLLLRPPL